MPEYQFHLRDEATRPPIDELVEARDDAEARDLAQLRLSLGRSWKAVQVRKNGVELFNLRRDDQS